MGKWQLKIVIIEKINLILCILAIKQAIDLFSLQLEYLSIL